LAKTGPAHTKHRSVETGSQTFTKIDELQHTMAHEHWKNFDKTKENSAKTSDCYDLFIRPMEQLFSKDRPMSASMLEATKDSIKLVWLTKQIAHIARIEQWVATDFNPFIKLSRFRHLNTASPNIRKMSCSMQPISKTSGNDI
jgi:hypothetical protein